MKDSNHDIGYLNKTSKRRRRSRNPIRRGTQIKNEEEKNTNHMETF
jgi:hypothetical protein